MTLPEPVAGTVLVTGADGFIGGFVCAALGAAGWRVVRGVRAGALPSPDARACDFAAQRLPHFDFASLLAGIDAVVNVAGILRELRRSGQTFDALHHDGPLALARACVAQGVSRFVQISAIGDPVDGPFMASKHRFDAALLALAGSGLRPLVLRPSVVCSPRGSYGGTTLLRALAAVPGFLPVPGHGQWLLQPVAAEDLARIVVQALVRPDVVGQLEVGGPEDMTLVAYQQAWRAWLRLPAVQVLRVPAPLITAMAWLGDRIGRGPMTMATWRMLRRGNVVATESLGRLSQALDVQARSLTEVLAAHPSQAQDRWHAQLGVLAPLLTAGIVLLFLLSAWAGLATPATQIEAMVAGTPLDKLAPVPLARALGVVDALLAVALLLLPNTRLVLSLMLLLVLGYTLTFGLLLPGAWLEPLGGLAKNLVVLPALVVAWVLAERR